MKRLRDVSPEFAALADQLLDGTINDQDLARLDALLAGDPNRQDFLLDYCQFHASLLFDQRAGMVMEKVIVDRHGGAPHEPAIRRRSPYVPSLRVVGPTMAAAAAVLALAWLTPAYIERNNAKPLPTAEAVASTGRPGVTSIQLDSGATKLALENIGGVVLEGPADFELIGPLRARLTRGRVRINVSERSGRGLIVEMPNGALADLGEIPQSGAEFGLDVADDGSAGLVVFGGTVDFSLPFAQERTAPRVQRLVEGDAVVARPGGGVDRMMSIFMGGSATFENSLESKSRQTGPVIVGVRDNLRTAETHKFYEVVLRGMRADTPAYVDRPRFDWQWTSAGGAGIPPYLVGADYIKPFNDDKSRRKLRITVALAQPARLFVFYDDRLSTPAWLAEGFRDTGDDIGMQPGPGALPQAVYHIIGRNPDAPATDVYARFSVWERIVAEPGEVELGPNEFAAESAMYGIAAAPYADE